MSRVVLHASISLDGYAVGDDDTGLGDVTRLHAWMSDDDPVSRAATTAWSDNSAVVLGRGTYRAGERSWNEEAVFHSPAFVVTHERREPEQRFGTTITFTDDIADAIQLASEASGDGDVVLMGGPEVARQALQAGLVNSLELQLVPVLLGAGSSLLAGLGRYVELDPVVVSPAPGMVRLRYDVRRA